MTVEELEAVVGAVLEDGREVAFGLQQPVTLFRAERKQKGIYLNMQMQPLQLNKYSQI